MKIESKAINIQADIQEIEVIINCMAEDENVQKELYLHWILSTQNCAVGGKENFFKLL